MNIKENPQMRYHFSYQERVKWLRKEYPEGAQVELLEMNDPYREMPPGLKGTVEYVDDAGGIHVHWENGSSLAVIDGIDRIRRISATRDDKSDGDPVMRIEDEELRCEWVNLDEGVCGDYGPDDPEDVNLLRFDVFTREDGGWEAVEDASYCTRMPVDADRETLERALRHIFDAYKAFLKDCPDYPIWRLGEKLSHLSPDDFAV